MQIDNMLMATRAAHIGLNERKCVFGATGISFLSMKVNLRGVHEKNRNWAVTNDGQVPVSAAQLQLFLGLIRNYWKCVHRFMHQTTKLYQLTADRCVSCLRQKHEAEFDDIWRRLAFVPVLPLHNTEHDYILCTDASEMALEECWLTSNPVGRRAGWWNVC